MVEWEKAVYVDVCTFDSLRLKGWSIVSLIEDVFKCFVFSYKLNPKIYMEKFDSESWSFRYNIKNWDRVVAMILKGEVRHMLVNYCRNEEVLQPEFALSITFDYSYQDELYKDTILANNIALSLNRRLFNLNISRDAQDTIKDIFIKTFKELNGVVGYINLGIPHATIAPNQTTFERLQGMEFTSHSQMFGTYARGYFWGNVLSEKHIESLGGIEIIKEKAPCCTVDDFTFGNSRRAVYLQLTEDINSYTDDQLRRLRDFLKPILPEINMSYINESDPSGEIRKSARIFFD